MQVQVQFYSYLKEVTGCGQVTVAAADGSTVDDLLRALWTRFPKLAGLEKSTLIAVGVEYQGRDYLLKDGDQLSLFPPVQGG